MCRPAEISTKSVSMEEREMSSSASKFLREFEEASEQHARSVTTSIDGETLGTVKKWQGGRSVKATVAWLIQKADRMLEEQRATESADKAGQGQEASEDRDA